VRTFRKAALLLLLTVPLLLVPAGPSVAKRVDVRLRLPASGQTLFAVTQLRFKGRAPRRLRVRLLKRARLDPAYRGLYAIYRRRRGGTTILTALNLVLRKQGAASRSLRSTASPSDEGDALQLAIFFFQAGLVPSFSTYPTLSEAERPTEPPTRIESALELGGVAVSPGVQSGALGPNLLDTGHYDDGHSFGWNSRGTDKAIGDWLHLSANNAPYEELIREIEEDIKADLDSDGEVGGGGSVDTVVGPPVISQP
jgi:hypothetical protein